MPWPQIDVLHDDDPENGFAVLSMIWRTCAGVRFGATDSIRLIAPTTSGVEKLVPPPAPMPHAVVETVVPPLSSTWISEPAEAPDPPGAEMSTVAPVLV